MLTEYLEHPSLEIDNNLVENAIRPTTCATSSEPSPPLEQNEIAKWTPAR